MSLKEKREQKRLEKILDRYGVVLNDVRAEKQPGRFYLCFLRGILIFLGVYGMLGALVTGFGLDFSRPVVISGIFILAFISAFLYYNKITFYLGYLAVFASFIFFSFSMYIYVNSGYQAFINVVYNKYSDYFRLASVREVTEFVDNRYLTITAAMLFMGWFFCILLNITISGYMSLALTFLVTFLPLQVAFYIDIVPQLHYLVMLIAVYISVAVLGRSGHFTLPYRHDKTQHFEYKATRKKNSFTYLASSGGMLSVTIYSLIIASLFMLIASSAFSKDFDGHLVSNKVKDKTDQLVKTVVQGGLASLLDRYSSKGGLAKGRLGGVGTVRPDYETDFYVQLPTDASSPVYLKSYTGVYYNDTYTYFHPYSDPDNIKFPMLTEEQLKVADILAPSLNTQTECYERMHIENIDADTEYDLSPYYTFYSDSNREQTRKGYSKYLGAYAAANYADSYDLLEYKDAVKKADPERNLARVGGRYDAYDLLFTPYDAETEIHINPNIYPEYEELVSNVYLQVPEGLEEAIDAFIDEADLWDLRDDPVKLTTELKQYFYDNFSYTMAPGMTPLGRDMVEYFLTEQRRGYCVHFAASTALILRRLGIPSRFIEGYYISPSDIMDAAPVTDDLEGWVGGRDANMEQAVVEVDVNDGSAHAWTEFYMYGYGWIPYDTTPPSDEDPLFSRRNEFFAQFFDLLRQTERNGGNRNNINLEAPAVNTNGLSMALGSLSFILRPVLISLACVIFLLLMRSPFLIFLKTLRRSIYAMQGRYNDALLIEYRKNVNFMQSKKLLSKTNPLPRDVRDCYCENLDRIPAAGITEEDLTALSDAVDRAAFSGRTIERELYLKLVTQLKKLRRIKK